MKSLLEAANKKIRRKERSADFFYFACGGVQLLRQAPVLTQTPGD